MDSLKRFNQNALTELIEIEESGEKNFLVDLIQTFSTDLGPTVFEMSKAAEASQLKELERAAHSLKSSSRVLGLEVLSEICRHIEESSRKGFIDMNLMTQLRNECGDSLTELVQFASKRKRPE